MGASPLQQEVLVKRTLSALAVLAVVGGAVAFSSTAAANSFAVSIGVPGLAVGYSNHGGYVAAYAPPVAYAPPAAYAPPVAYAPAPVYYDSYWRPPVVYYGYRPAAHRYYGYRHW
jgi:hypothetical protein